MDLLKDKVAVITGAGSGMGRATCLRFAAEGATLVAVDREPRSVQETAQLVRAQGGAIIAVESDVSEPEDVQGMVRAAVDTYGRIDILYNNAGIEGEPGKRTADTSLENWDRIININLKGVFLGMKYTIPVMLRQGGGNIISTASLAGLVGVPQLAAYAASKGGIVQLTKSAALEYAEDNIRINGICPGYIVTAMTDRLMEFRGDDPATRGATNPMGRPGTADEIAKAAVWLASDLSSYVTGLALPVDGGSYAR